MASSTLFLKLALVAVLACTASAQLTPLFYLTRCPTLSAIVFSTVNQAVRNEPRMGSSLVRLFFHDCFVNGCDASVLLDDTPTQRGEKNAFPNQNSLRGFEVIDAIKTRVEAACPGVVSCADILALAARDSVLSLGGVPWIVPLGRRDARTASESAANSDLPAPSSSLSELISNFSRKGLSARDMTALSGAHTIGQSQCANFRDRLNADTNIDPAFRALRRGNCPTTGGDSNLAPLDVQTPNRFDNAYFTNLLAQRGLLHSDQELFNNGSQDALVRTYALSNAVFLLDFAAVMVKMGNISPLTGTNGEIRRNCRVIN